MGLGGDLIYTAASRELQNASGGQKIYLCEHRYPLFQRLFGFVPSTSLVFANNPRITKTFSKEVLVVNRSRQDLSYVKKITKDKFYFIQDRHAVQIICDAFGVDAEDCRPELYFLEEEFDWLDKYLKGIPNQYIVVEPNGKTDTTPNRLWISNYWQLLIDRLCRVHSVVQVGDGSGINYNNVIQLNGKTSFRKTALLLKKASLFIGTVGGLMHAARAVETRSVIIHSGYEPLYMASYRENINLYAGAGCAPCGLLVQCPHEMMCMTEITPEVVYKKAVAVLNDESDDEQHQD